MKLVLLGDSVLAGCVVVKKQSCESILRRKLGKSWVVVNRSVGGSSTKHLISRLGNALATKPDFVVVQVQINDAQYRMPFERHVTKYHPAIEKFRRWFIRNFRGMRWTSPKEYEKNLRYIIRRVKSGGAIPLVLTSNHLEEKIWPRSNESIDEYRKIIIKVCQAENAALVDFFKAYQKYGRKIIADGKHLNAFGQKLLADMILRSLKRQPTRSP